MLALHHIVFIEWLLSIGPTRDTHSPNLFNECGVEPLHRTVHLTALLWNYPMDCRLSLKGSGLCTYYYSPFFVKIALETPRATPHASSTFWLRPLGRYPGKFFPRHPYN